MITPSTVPPLKPHDTQPIPKPIKSPRFPAKTRANKIPPHKTTLNHPPFMLIYYKEPADAPLPVQRNIIRP
ncbi:hypothetical protein [Endozoicomonas sp. ALE010]|uniref:hypothetical protein n=1 Tax=Endozoicomonas sp. ALE010 TaxID=3403081 RepID=UPI003BB597A2